MTNFTNVFSGSVIRPAEVSYLPVTMTADITLDWSLESNAPEFPAAATIDVTSTVGAFAITLPDATQGSAGTAILFNGLSANTQTVQIKDYGGASIATLASGTQWLLVLADTATAAGVWRAFQLGATTSAATAGSLAGYGITASGGLLSQSTSVTTFASSPRTVLLTDRASLMTWTGAGSATFNLPAAATAGNNFFVMARNGGGGDLTVDPSGSELINGAATIALHPGDSALLVTDGLAWYSVGLGRSASFAFDFTSISVAGAPATYTLSGAELNRVSYKFTGLLTNDVAIIVPATVQQYWVENATSGSYALTLKTSGGTPVTVTQGGRDIYYSNGTNVVRATTGGIAVPIGVTDGGTGLSSYAVGDILYASGATTLSKLADVAIGNALISGGVGASPTYGKIGLATHVSGTLAVANGGTGITSFGTGVATALGVNVGSSGAFITFNGALGIPSSGTATNLTGLPLTSGVTGTLPVANGGTGVTASTGTGSNVLSASPTLTGAPLAPTAAPGTNTTQIASTAFVTAAVTAGGGMTYPAAGIGNSTGSAWGTSYTVSGTGAVLAATVSPAFTGTPTAPTAAGGTNTTQLATTAFVTSAVAGGGSMVYPGAGIPVSTGSAWTTSLSATAPNFTTSVTSPLVQGGAAASSTLTLRSTSGVGTSDSIVFKTGNNVTCATFETGGGLSLGPNTSGGGKSLYMGGDLTGSTGLSISVNNTVQSSVTSLAVGLDFQMATANASFTTAAMTMMRVGNVAKGSGHTITNLYGVDIYVAAGTNNFGVRSQVSAAASNWNIYASGSAANYMAGDLRIGTTTQNGSNALTVSGGAAVTNITYTTSYTVATLPTGVQGMRAYVTDATAPTFLGALTGGGAVKCPVFYNGSAWVAG